MYRFVQRKSVKPKDWSLGPDSVSTDRLQGAIGIDAQDAPPYGPAPLTIGTGNDPAGVGTALALE
jgi:hypothetical protein